MPLFGSLNEKLSHIFSKLTGRGKLTELEIKNAMREIRIALLEADVNFKVAKDFINTVTEKAIGEKVLESLTPDQQVIKIVRDELTSLMGGGNVKLSVASNPPTIIMMCGLQGAGKTSTCGKLGAHLKKQGKKVLLVACDIYRPAAINQLKIVAKSAGVEFFEEGTTSPAKIAQDAIAYAKKQGLDTVIIDTAGRLQIDEKLMQELEDIKSAVNPTEILLTVDAMTGQQSADVAQTFNERLDVSGVILTKLDGDTRGGSALSIKAVTGKPIKFTAVGEKIEDLEPFYPDRMAQRILGMGDVLTLIEKVEKTVDEKQMKEMEEKLRKNTFTLDDFLVQFDQIGKMGNLTDLVSMIPGVGNKLAGVKIDEHQIVRFKSIIQSMTKEERFNPSIINGSRKKRIAQGSATSIQDVNTLLKQYNQTKDLMKNMNNGKLAKMFGRRFGM